MIRNKEMVSDSARGALGWTFLHTEVGQEKEQCQSLEVFKRYGA